jgi:hypothetical protein
MGETPIDPVYQNWNWEQVFTGVCGPTVPGRGDITATQWIMYDHGENVTEGTEKSRTYLFYADRYDPKNGIEVYLNEALIKPDSPWTRFVNVPLEGLREAFVKSSYQLLGGIDPKTFESVREALTLVQGQFAAKATDFDSRYKSLGGDGSGFKGKAAGAFHDLIGNLHTVFADFDSQMLGKYTKYAMAGAVGDSSTAARNFVVDLWNTLDAWSKKADCTPWMAIYNTFMPTVKHTPKFIPKGKWGSESYWIDIATCAYGDLNNASTWAKIETAAKARWVETLGVLDTGGRTAITALANAYNKTAGALLPLELPPLKKIEPDPEEEKKEKEKDNGLKDFGKDVGKGLKDLGDGFGKGFKDLGDGFGKGFKDLGDGFGNGFKDLGGGLDGLGDGLGGGLDGLGDGLGGGLKGLGNDLGNGFGKGLDGLGGGLDNLGKGVDGGLNGLGGGLDNLGKGLDGGLGDLGNGVGGGLDNLGKGVDGGLDRLRTGLLGPVVPHSGGGGGIRDQLRLGPSDRRKDKIGDLPGQGNSPLQERVPVDDVTIPVAPPPPLISKSPAGPGGQGLGNFWTAGQPGAAGAAGTAGQVVSSGKFIPPGSQNSDSPGAGPGGIPMFPPMAGGMGGQGQQQPQERERTTWLSEDEDVWGTEPDVGLAVIGRDDLTAEEEDGLQYVETDDRRDGRGRQRVEQRGR